MAIARAEGASVAYVKAHGALYNLAERDSEAAGAVAEAARLSGVPFVVAPAGSAMTEAAAAAGVRLVAEGFVDRAYDDLGRLVSRDHPGSLIAGPAAVAERAVGMVCRGEVRTISGGCLRLTTDTICLHGDTPDAPVLARAVRQALSAAGVQVVAFG
jgi:UPF0271 protein